MNKFSTALSDTHNIYFRPFPATYIKKKVVEKKQLQLLREKL